MAIDARIVGTILALLTRVESRKIGKSIEIVFAELRTVLVRTFITFAARASEKVIVAELL